MVRILVVNAGSSSLKLTLIDEGSERPIWALSCAPGELPADLPGRLGGGVDAVGHRIVHGGPRFGKPVLIDGGVRAALEELVDLAPLHQPKSLAALDGVTKLLPEVPAVACFDTAFHATLPQAAHVYALPEQWRERWDLRRYGFHGLSHAWIARRVPELLGRDPGELRIVSCHLGSGASLCAIDGGRSVDTTMGFTPLEGLVMSTRSGSVDPGLLLWLLERCELSEAEMACALEHDAGLLGLTGTADMREVLSRAAEGEERAQLGLSVYLHRLRAGIAAMAASLEGADVVAFTGGVGENAPEIRGRAMSGLAFVLRHEGQVLTVPAREDLEVARQTAALLAAG